jgi:hypothetical protein
MVRASCPALLPVHHQKVLFEGCIVVAEERRLAGARPAVQEDQGRVGCVHATKPEALGDVAYGHGFHGRDAARDDVTVRICECAGVNAPGRHKEPGQTDDNSATTRAGFQVRAFTGSMKMLGHGICGLTTRLTGRANGAQGTIELASRTPVEPIVRRNGGSF